MWALILLRLRTYTPRAPVQIGELVINYYLMNISLKFHKDLSFRCGDICKTILAFVYSLILIFIFSYFTIMEKITPVSPYRYFSSPSNYLRLFRVEKVGSTGSSWNTQGFSQDQMRKLTIKKVF